MLPPPPLIVRIGLPPRPVRGDGDPWQDCTVAPFRFDDEEGKGPVVAPSAPVPPLAPARLGAFCCLTISSQGP